MKLTMQKVVLVASAVVVASVVPVRAALGFGGCPSPALIQLFSQTLYLGNWYEYGRYASISQVFEPCAREKYSQGFNDVINVKSTYMSSNELQTSVGQMKRAVPGTTDSNYSITYDEGGFAGQENEETEANYKIVATDYFTYAIIWSCTEAFILNFPGVRVLTRDANPTDDVSADIEAEIESLGLSSFLLVRTNQDCE